MWHEGWEEKIILGSIKIQMNSIDTTLASAAKETAWASVCFGEKKALLGKEYALNTYLSNK